MGQRPWRILVTRAEGQASELADALRRMGADPVLVPTIETVSLADSPEFETGLRAAELADWVVFTSPRAVEIVLPRLRTAARTAVVGRMTAKALAGWAADPPVMAETPVQTADALAEVLAPLAAGKRIVFFRAEAGRGTLPERLQAAGADLLATPTYRTVAPRGLTEALRSAWSAGLDAATFTSSSSAQNLAAALDTAGLLIARRTLKASIGPVTTETLKTLGWDPQVEASTTSVQSLAEATVLYLNMRYDAQNAQK